jgi:hypothetical protein
MAGLAEVEVVRSVSLFGLSYVGVYFKDNVDIYFARRLVGEKLQEVKGRLPEGYGEPELGPNSSGLGQVFWYTIEDADKKLSAMDLRTLQDWTVRLILRTAPGVDDVTTWGGHEKQYQVQIDPRRLVKYGLSFKEVMERWRPTTSRSAASPQHRRRAVPGARPRAGEQCRRHRRHRRRRTQRRAGLRARCAEGEGGAGTCASAPSPATARKTVLGIALARINENAKTVVEAVKAKLAIAQAALPKGVELKAGLRPHRDRRQGAGDLDQRADRRLDPGRGDPVPLPRRVPLRDRRDRHAAAGDAVRLHLHAALRHVGQPDVAGRTGHRHRDDGRRRGGDGRERLPAALARTRVGPADQPDARGARSGARSGEPDRLRDHDHHRRVPAAVLADGAGRQAVQADGADHHVRDGRLAAAVADAGAGAGGPDPQAQGGEGHLAGAWAKKLYLPLLDWALDRKKP